jgi:glucose 1-dehydrogenase
MTEMLAHELAPHITVNAVALGAILPPPGADISYLENMAQTQVPLKRPGSPEIVAENVLHLLRQDFLTGVVIPIDGGQFL